MWGTTSSASFASVVYHGLQILAFSLPWTHMPSLQVLPPSHVCCLHQVFSRPQLLEKPSLFLDFSFLRGKAAYSYSALVSKQSLLTACNSPGAPTGACNVAQGPVTHATGWELWVLLQPEDLHERRERYCTADWFTDPGPWICTSSLHSPLSQNLDCRRNAFLPHCVCAQGYSWSHAISMKSFHGT